MAWAARPRSSLPLLLLGLEPSLIGIGERQTFMIKGIVTGSEAS